MKKKLANFLASLFVVIVVVVGCDCDHTATSPITVTESPTDWGPVLKAFFGELDKNQDQIISRDEILFFLRSESYFSDWGVIWHGIAVKGVLDSFDHNSDGAIVPEEARREIARAVSTQFPLPIQKNHSENLFAAIDADRDGRASSAEIESFVLGLLRRHAAGSGIAHAVAARCLRKLLISRAYGIHKASNHLEKAHFFKMIEDLNSFVK